jgi:hypothetical protein
MNPPRGGFFIARRAFVGGDFRASLWTCLRRQCPMNNASAKLATAISVSFDDLSA